MPYVCAFPGCPKKVGALGRARRKVSMFRLPTSNPVQLKIWCDILSLDINNLSAGNTERVCSQHFNLEDIRVEDDKTTLVEGAVPIWSKKCGKQHGRSYLKRLPMLHFL
jgi:hypothetical protein